MLCDPCGPLVICAPGEEEIFRRHGVESVRWEDFLISGRKGRASLAEAPAGKGTEGYIEVARWPTLGQGNAGRSLPTPSP
jgi:hypothetical protein